ncbi:MAG: MerR family DNA-binding transcriptional regulator, partial [Moorea sp. SIO3E2]|nr:MerR family DNA-binding transcriptional regulator [Moorena sp. SIO3E2]
MALVPIRKAVELTGLSRNTLRKYADNGTIKSERTPSGYR